MVKIFFILIAVFICFQIVRQPGHMKIIWLFAGLLFFPHSVGITNEPIALSFHRLFIYTTVLVVFFTRKTIFTDIKQMPLMRHLTIAFVCLLAIGLADQRLTLFHKIYRPVTYFIENLLVLFLAYIYISKKEHGILFYKRFLVFVGLFCLYGISNYITKTNEYYSLLSVHFRTSDFANANMSEYVQRFRVSSFSFHAILYGLVLATSVFVFFYLQYFHDRRKLKFLQYALLGLIFVNLLLVNSRTPFISVAAGFLIFFFFALRAPAKMQLVLVGIILFVVSGAYFSDFRDTMIASLDIFSKKDTEILGSSLEMREEQFKASLDYFKRNPIAGNGFQYINENLGYSSDRSQNFAPQELRGFESYVFKVLIEQGLMGVICNLVIFGGMFLFFFKRIGNSTAILGLAILTSFILFIVGTGDLNSFPFVMVILGVTIKTVQLSAVSRVRKISAPSGVNMAV